MTTETTKKSDASPTQAECVGQSPRKVQRPRWRKFQADVDEHVSVSSGILSPALGDVWRYGCPKKSPNWDSDIGVWAGSEGIDEDNEEVSEVNTKGLRKVWEGPCWEGMWPFPDPWHVAEMRWNIHQKKRS